MTQKRRFHKRPENDICDFNGCQSIKKTATYCLKHHARYSRHGDASIVKPYHKSTRKCLVIQDGQDCSKKHSAKDMCQMHYRRNTLYGDPLISMHTGRSPARYRMITAIGHANARPNGRILEHRLVMSQMIGRPLKDEENVHHINGDRYDNRPENLELWSKSQPSGQRIPDKVNWAIELLELYAPNKLRNTNE
jgi:hypothetical protein